MESRQRHEIIAERLEVYLGRNTARVALRTFSERACRRAPEELAREDVPVLLEALRPMLRTLLGRERAEDVLRQLEQELG